MSVRAHRGAGATPALAGIAALALTAGCVPTLGRDTPSSSTTTEAVGRGQLTEEQLRSVLPADDQPPSGFTLDTSQSEGPDPDSTTYPAVCDDVRLQGTTADDLEEHKVASAQKSYVGENGRGVLSVKVTSYDEPVPEALFDDAGQALSRCSTFKIIDRHGTSDWKLDPVSLQPAGDRTWTIRVQNTTEGDAFGGGVVQVASASLGNNRVHVVQSAGEASTYRSEAVEQLVGATVAELEAL